ncbi:MAG TPA: hypothetical protein VJU58_09220, partial [Microbacterium sp.]|nr:hypothetical protein [Microbacterium sp.]
MTTRLTIGTLTELALPEQPGLSPDGEQVVYVLRTVDAAADRTLRNLWRRPVAGGAAVRLTRGDADTTPRFSPDGRHLSFLRANDGPAQI